MLKLPAIIVSVSLTAFARPTGDVAQFTYDAASPTSQSVHRFVGRGGGVSIVINNADPRKFTYSLFTRLATDSDDKLAEVAHTLNASLVLPKEPDPADMGDFQEGYPSDKDIVANIKEGARKYFSNEGEAAKTALKDMPKGLTTERNSVALDKDGKPAFTADKQKNLEKAYDKVAAYVSSVNDAVNTALQYYTPRVLSLSATGFQVDTMVVLKQIRVDDAKSATVVGKYTIDVARPPKIVGTLNTSLYFTSGTRDILSYRALDAYDSGGARIKLNGQDAFRIVGDRLSTSIEPNIGGVVYFAFDEQRFRLSGYRTGLMLGVDTSANTTSSASYKAGFSLFLDRDLSSAFSFGVAFRRGQVLAVPGQSLGDLIVSQIPQTNERWATVLFVGLSYSFVSSSKGN